MREAADLRPVVPEQDGRTEATSTLRVAICALTFLRPNGLTRLLQRLEELDLPSGVAVSTIVVDNDPEQSARDLVESTARRGLSIEYVSEPRRGISTARNTAVASALAWDADRICFIDDDEWPAADWLAEFLETRRVTGADIVTGPVLPVFDETPPEWVVDGGFFDRPRYPHNSKLGYATTSTVMIDAVLLRDRPEPFDPAFSMSGGSDTHLFAQLVDEGHTIAWCDTALVFEAIPVSRVDARWILRREYRRGQTLSRSLRRRQPTIARLTRRAANGMLQIGAGSLRTLLRVFRGRAAVLIGVKQVVFGVGMLTGLAERRYEEYHTVHGG